MVLWASLMAGTISSARPAPAAKPELIISVETAATELDILFSVAEDLPATEKNYAIVLAGWFWDPLLEEEWWAI